MFTGIITHIGIVEELTFSAKKDCLLAISVQQKVLRKLEIGCSIACDGICLTLIKKVKNKFYFQASDETCAKTTLSKWVIGKKVNLEFALRVGDEFGGHIVSGHVDGCAKLKARKAIKDSVQIEFQLEKKSQTLKKFIVTKGSVCLNGVSLTINKVRGDSFLVNLIPHSLNNCNLGDLVVGNLVNVEIDLVARYLKKM